MNSAGCEQPATTGGSVGNVFTRVSEPATTDVLVLVVAGLRLSSSMTAAAVADADPFFDSLIVAPPIVLKLTSLKFEGSPAEKSFLSPAVPADPTTTLTTLVSPARAPTSTLRPANEKLPGRSTTLWNTEALRVALPSLSWIKMPSSLVSDRKSVV